MTPQEFEEANEAFRDDMTADEVVEMADYMYQQEIDNRINDAISSNYLQTLI